MIDDVTLALPAAITVMRGEPGTWMCLGVVDHREDIEPLATGLGPGFEIRAEPCDATDLVGSHHWVRPRRTWEVWARAV